MHTVVGRNAAELREFAQRWGWQHHTTDWHGAVTTDDIGLVDIGTPNNVLGVHLSMGASGSGTVCSGAPSRLH